MAELNQNQSPDTRKKRVRKTAPKVDLTAMVDLAFLLITFFMLTTSLNKANSLDVVVPDKSNNSTQNMDENRIVSLLIHEGEVTWFHGAFENPLSPPQRLSLGDNGLRQVLIQMRDRIPNLADGKDMVVLIKPSAASRTIDLVQTLDEMKISHIKRYMLSKISASEQDFILASND